MASLADHAYSHCRAVIGPSPIAVDLAVTAVRRGGRSRLAALSFARAAALAEAEPAWAATLAAAFAAPVPTDVPDVAEALALTRPPLERAVVDLALRHGLDRGGLGRALGLAPAAAA